MEDKKSEACPPGHTMINGRCVPDITPPPPGLTDSEETKDSEDVEG